MSRHLNVFEDFRNLNLHAEIVVKDGQPQIKTVFTVDTPSKLSPNGYERLASERFYTLREFLDQAREHASRPDFERNQDQRAP